MRSMFVRLFFWFWTATILSGGICFLLAINLRLNPEHERRMHRLDDERRRFVVQALATYGKSQASLYEKGIREEALPPGSGFAYLFTGKGEAISPGVPAPLRDALLREAQRSQAAGVHPAGAVIVPVSGPSGTGYLAAAQWLHPHPTHAFQGIPLPPGFWLNLAITFLTGGVVCYLLAWRLTVPIRRLRAAAQRVAEGDLSARVEVGAQGRGDELADLSGDFNLMAGRIEKLIESQKQLVRDISHELRSPLARLAVALELARKVSPKAAEGALSRIESEGVRLNLLIGELLTLCRLEAREESALGELFDLAELVVEVARDADFEARSLRRSVEVCCTSPTPFRGNRELLRRALENVMRNGVRYTGEGSAVQVSLEMERGGKRYLVRVRDHGPGVPEEKLAEIFRPFYRVEEARDRQSGGTGIGLAISERTVLLHAGEISARNAPGGGLEVEVRLPVR